MSPVEIMLGCLSFFDEKKQKQIFLNESGASPILGVSVGSGTWIYRPDQHHF
jgi:hypothetical protein